MPELQWNGLSMHFVQRTVGSNAWCMFLAGKNSTEMEFMVLQDGAEGTK